MNHKDRAQELADLVEASIKGQLWESFKDFVAAELIGRGIVDTIPAGREFSEALDMSFDELYEKVPPQQWRANIKRDCDEYVVDLKRLKDS